MDAARTSPLLFLALFCTSCSQSQPTPMSNNTATAPLSAQTTQPIAPPPASRLAERTIDLGTSVEGRPLTLHVFGDAPNPTLILGAIHGNEPTSATLAQHLIDYLRQHPEALPPDTGVAILPVANPDGLALKTRTNKNHIDVNRNFPAANWAKRRRTQYFGGEQSSSEPETLAIIAAFDRLRPARVISIHSMDAPCNNYDGPARDLAESMSRHNGYPVKDNIGYPTPGSLGNWAGTDRHIPIVTLELPRKLDADRAWEQNRAALLGVLRSQ
jgi:protein MpaA